MADTARCCQNCKGPCAGDFKQVADLQYSGLVIYVHSKKDQKKAGPSKFDDTFILHNTGPKQLKKPDYVKELYKFKTQCEQCKTTVNKVRSLLDEIRHIRENEVIGVCDYCKRTSLNKTCKRCDFIVSEFISMYRKRCEEKKERFKVWLCKVKHLLQAILNGENVCQHKLYKDTELERMLRQLKTPLSMREPDIAFFPALDPEQLTSVKNLSESKDMLDELLSKIKFDDKKHFTSDDSLYPSPSKETCICKYIKERYLKGKSSELYIEKSESSKDIVFNERIPTNDLSKLLNEDVYKKLIQKLLQLSKALPSRLHLNKELVLGLIKSLNTGINQGLNMDIIKTLINGLKELSKILIHDESKDLNSKFINELIQDLQDLLTLGSSKNLYRDVISLLVNVSGLLSHELSIGLSDESQILNKSRDKDIELELSKSVHADMTPKPPKGVEKKNAMKKLQRTSSFVKSKEVKSSLSREINKQMALKLGVLYKTLANENINNERVKELAVDLNKALVQGLPNLNKKLVKELTDLCQQIAQGIPSNADENLIQDLLTQANKVLAQGLSKDQNKKHIQELLKKIKEALKRTNIIQHHLSSELKHKGKKIQKSVDKHDGPKYAEHRKLEEDTYKDKNISKFKEDTYKDRKISKFKEDTYKDRNISKFKEDSYKDRKISKLKEDTYNDSKISKDIYQDKVTRRKDLSRSDKLDRSRFKKKSQIEKIPNEKQGKISSKEKENLSPESKNAEKSPKERQNKTQQKSSTKLEKAGKVSEAILLRMLRGNKDSSERYKVHKQKELTKQKQKELAKEKEMERRRLKELAMKKIHPVKEKDVVAVPPVEISESIIVECEIHAPIHKLMIRGNEITPYDPRYKDQVDLPVEPLNFKTEIKFLDAIPKKSTSIHCIKSEESSFEDGILRYRLSNKQFIDKGWTKLPTNKVMRKMNIYRMEPANPQYDWFERHKQEKLLFYDSGEKLADIDDNCRGHWFYRNGAIALDYYNAQESNIGQRYVVYSSGEEIENGKLRQRTVLALFDVLGNGVVYDLKGNVRLKYNQSEGIIIDPKLGAPGKWKWHDLNEPPVLQQVLVNTRMKERDPDIELIEKPDKSENGHEDFIKPPDLAMLAIELDNFVKEKANKILQKFKPFKIMMKAVKLNEHFSLKILDQANIYLLFRDGVISLKLNLGRLLVSNEIVDTDTSDIADVATPYDKYPPKTESVENIQKILKTVRSGKLRSPSECTTKV